MHPNDTNYFSGHSGEIRIVRVGSFIMTKEFLNIKLLIGLGNPGKEYEHTYHNAGRLFADYLLKNLSSLHAADKLKFRKPTASKNFEYMKTEDVTTLRSSSTTVQSWMPGLRRRSGGFGGVGKRGLAKASLNFASRNSEEEEATGVSPWSFVFVRPLLFMNESGAVVQAALKFFNIKPEKFLVIHDDSDIEIGSYKISFGRGAGGHHGAKSIIQKLKTKDFWRLRIGIRPAADKRGTETRINADNVRDNQRNHPRKSAPRARAGDFVLKKISPTDEKILYSTFRDIENKLFRQ